MAHIEQSINPFLVAPQPSDAFEPLVIEPAILTEPQVAEIDVVEPETAVASISTSTVPELTRRQRLSNFYTMAGIEASQARIGDMALFSAAALGVAFEWGPFNEQLLGRIGVDAHNHFGSSGSLLQSLQERLATGLVTGGVSGAEQFLIALTFALALRRFPDTFRQWQNDRPPDARTTVSNSSIVSTSLAFGASAAIVEKNVVTTAPLREDIKFVAKAVGIIGLFNVAFVSGVSGVVEVVERNVGEAPANFIENVAKNPLTYILTFGGIKLWSLRNERKERRARQAEQAGQKNPAIEDATV